MVTQTRELIYMTDAGRAALEAEVACLRRLEQDVVAEQCRLAYAVEWALVGNPASAAELAAIEREIDRLGRVLRNATYLVPGDGRAGVGSRVLLRGSDGTCATVGVVGPVAANARLGLVSYESPLGKALLGRRVGETVEVIDGRGTWQANIVGLGTLPQQEPTG